MKQDKGKSVLTQNLHSVAQQVPHKQNHIQAGQYLKSSIYGGLDGVVNTLAVIIGGIASGAHPSAILAVGISVMVGDGLGMGLGDYLSAKAEKQFTLSEQKRELWEVQHKLQDQRKQVIQIYIDKNYTQQQAHRLTDLFTTNKKAFVNIMMLEELGLVVDDSNPMWNGLITFLSFALFGFVPIIPYVIGWGIKKDDTTQYLWISLVLAGVLLFSLGFMKAFILGLNKIKSGVETVVLGAIAVSAGYGIGLLFGQ